MPSVIERVTSGSVRGFVRAWAANTKQDKDAGRPRTSRYVGSRGRGHATVCSRPGTQPNLRTGPLEAGRPAVQRLELEQELAVLDGLGVADVDLAHDRLDLGLHLVHQLHRLEDAEGPAGGHLLPFLRERGRAGLAL